MTDPFEDFTRKVSGEAYRTLNIIKKHHYVFDDLEDRWQKLAFTFYSNIAQLSDEAIKLIEDELEEDSDGQ